MSRAAWRIALVAAAMTTVAQPAGAAEPRASLDIDTSDIGEEGPVVKRRVRERTDVALRTAGVLPARPDTTDAMIHVDIDMLPGEDPGYQFELWVTRSGVLVGQRRQVECTLCTESEVVARVEATVTEILGQLDTLVPDEPEPGPEPELAVGPEPTVEPEPEPEPMLDRPRLSGLGRAGVGLMSVGVMGVGVGAVLVALPPTVNAEDPLYETTTRPPGFAVLGAGAAVLVSGVVMLVVDRKRARARTASLMPTVTPRGAALVWRGRF